MSKFNPYDPIPEGLRKSIEITQRLTESMRPILETQEAIRAMTRPIEEIAAISRTYDLINRNSLALDSLAAANETARLIAPALEMKAALYEPIGLAALNMSDFHIDTSAFQIASKVASVLPPNYMSTIQSVLDSYAPIWERTVIQSPFLNWLNTVDISPLTRIWEHWDIDDLLKDRYEQLNHLHLQVMYKAKWFPYASTLADDALFEEINEIIFSSRIDDNVSKRCEKRIDKAILSYYTPKEIKRIKKQWKSSEIEPFMKKALGQALDAYLRKEYALVIPFLATMWEGIIKAKTVENTKKPKEDFKKLVDENGYDDVFSDFYNNMIIGTCYSVEDVIDGVPNRNGVAHGWYVKYPSQKAALNAILLTHFVINLKPKNKNTTNTQEELDNG